MNSVLFLILRRMRAPLILIILSYAIAVLGMTLMPGVDAQGQPAPGMSFFHAFYVISYTATTIGFGEVPSAFSEAQRAWVTLSIYLTVIAWLYGIGNIIALVQDPDFRRVIRASRFQRKVAGLHQGFYLICGCGETGNLLLKALDSRNQLCVVLDIDHERISELEIGEYRQDIPALAADARLPENLVAAGLLHPHCMGVIAMTNDDQANLSVAVTAKLMRPKMQVLCRADTTETAENLASFHTDHIVNAFEVFGKHLAMALNAPGHYLIYEWLTGIPGSPLIQPLRPPRGTWVVCGYGRFGKAVVHNLRKQGIEPTIVESTPDKTGCTDCIVGRGTEAHTLIEAGILDATGVVAGTDHDVNNISIMMTAKELNPELFMVARQNRHANTPLFERFNAHITMQPSHIVAHEFLSLLTTPLLNRFLLLSRQQDNAWANEVVSRILGVVNETVPEAWDIRLSRKRAWGVWQALKNGQTVLLRDLLRDPSDRQSQIACVPLMLRNGKHETLLPDLDQPLTLNDEILFCGLPRIRHQQVLGLRNYTVLNYLLTGHDMPGGLLWQWLDKRRRSRTAD